jgi:hypothetical protein
MGVWMHLYVAPADSRQLSHREFEELIRDLVSAPLVHFPATLFIGDIDLHPLGAANRAYRAGNDEIPAAYHGADKDALLQALRGAPYHEQDLCIHFESLNTKDNPDLRASFEEYGFYNADVVVYALSCPRRQYIANLVEGSYVERMLQDFFTTTGKSGPWKIAGTALEPSLARHLGPKLSVDCGYA